MVRPQKVKPGDVLKASTVNHLIDRLPEDPAGTAAVLGHLNPSKLLVKNNSGTDRDIGEVLVVDSWTGPLAASFRDIQQGASFGATDPTWHTDFTRIGVCVEPIPNGDFGYLSIAGVALAKCSAVSTGDPFAELDPASVNVLKGATSGFAKVLEVIGSTYAIVDMSSPQHLWRYTLTQDSLAPSGTTANLKEMDGTQFATTITLSDPESFMADQINGDTGFCMRAGNEFYAIQAVC